MLRLTLCISFKQFSSMRVYLSAYFCLNLRLLWRQSYGCSSCVHYNYSFSKIKAKRPFYMNMCVPLQMSMTGCYVLTLCRFVTPPALTYAHNSGSPSNSSGSIRVAALLPGMVGGGLCTVNTQENITSGVFCQWETSCPTHTQRWPTLFVLFPMFLKCEIEPRCSIEQRGCARACACVCRAAIPSPALVVPVVKQVVTVSHIVIECVFTHTQARNTFTT